MGGLDRAALLSWANHHDRRPSLVLSFLLSAGGAAFIFPNTSVYPEATQRITTRPGTKTPLRDLFTERHLRTPRESCDLSHVIPREPVLEPKRVLNGLISASVGLEPKFSQTVLLEIPLTGPELRDAKQSAPWLAAPEVRRAGRRPGCLAIRALCSLLSQLKDWRVTCPSSGDRHENERRPQTRVPHSPRLRAEARARQLFPLTLTLCLSQGPKQVIRMHVVHEKINKHLSSAC